MNYIFLLSLSLIGFGVSFYIYYTKKYGKQLYCVIGQDCNSVVRSKYGKTFGIENTIPGMMYYLLIFCYAILMPLNRNIFKDNIFYYSIVSASIASVLFSVYLTGVQAFVLKKWCEYCIVSLIASLLILLVLIL